MTEPGPDVSVRLAWPEDGVSIAALQDLAWAEAYQDENLQRPSPAELANRWAELVTAAPDARVRVLVALERTAVRGVALVGPSYDPDSDQIADGELMELTVDPAHRNVGHGSRLLQAAIDTLSADHFRRATWWVDSVDDARRRFAVDAGWGPDGASRELEGTGGSRLRQVRLHTALDQGPDGRT